MERSQGDYEIWGLTGGIASGKSAAARVFEREGFTVIDADAIARELREPGGGAHDKIVSALGTADREKLRSLVFSDPQARKTLEAILHPLIVQESLRRVSKAEARATQDPVLASKKRHYIYEAALLVETGRYKDLAGLIVVDAPPEVRRSRLIAREGMAPELADRILTSQIADSQRNAAATYIIPNATTLDDLERAVRDFIRARGW